MGHTPCVRYIYLGFASGVISVIEQYQLAQMLAYYTAVAKGTDVDQHRNLAKSVTVE